MVKKIISFVAFGVLIGFFSIFYYPIQDAEPKLLSINANDFNLEITKDSTQLTTKVAGILATSNEMASIPGFIF